MVVDGGVVLGSGGRRGVITRVNTPTSYWWWLFWVVVMVLGGGGGWVVGGARGFVCGMESTGGTRLVPSMHGVPSMLLVTRPSNPRALALAPLHDQTCAMCQPPRTRVTNHPLQVCIITMFYY